MPQRCWSQLAQYLPLREIRFAPPPFLDESIAKQDNHRERHTRYPGRINRHSRLTRQIQPGCIWQNQLCPRKESIAPELKVSLQDANHCLIKHRCSCRTPNTSSEETCIKAA